MHISGEQSWLFTGILPDGYGPPGSFCFDYSCGDEPIMVSKKFLLISAKLYKRKRLSTFVHFSLS